MRNLSLIIIVFIVALRVAYAVDVANCSNPSGKSYFPFLGLMDKKDSGWSDDKISDGVITLTKNDANEYDLLYIDTTKRITSSKADGGTVIFLRKGLNEAAFLVSYQNAIEIYTFIIDKSKNLEYTYTSNRFGDGVLIPKATVMKGDCSFINLDLIK